MGEMPIQTCLKKDRVERNPNNYFDGRYGYYLAIVGQLYGRGWGEGDVIITSEITKIDEKSIVIENGISYKLGEKHSHYKQLLKAVCNQVPIIRQWTIGTIDNKGPLYLTGYIRNSGEIQPDFSGRISKQIETGFIMENGEEVFVDFFSMSEKQEFELYADYGVRKQKDPENAFCGWGYLPNIENPHGIVNLH